jgi:transposase
MGNKDLTAGKREAIFIFKNENKSYAEIAKLLEISRSSVYLTLKNFGPTSFSSQKTNMAGGARPTNLMTQEL